MKRGTLIVAVVFIFVFSGSLVSFDFPHCESTSDSMGDSTYQNESFSPKSINHISDTNEIEGILNPAVIEQRGNKTNPVLHAETDSGTNVKSNLSLDTANNWVGSRASVELWNLERLYVVNGSLSEGI